MTIKLSPLVNIGVIVPNAEEAYQLLFNLFSAQKVQEELTNFLNGDLAKVIHVGLDDVILRFIEPIVKEGAWYNHLINKGPGVYNLRFIVENIKDVIEEMEKQGGIDPLFTFDLEWENLLRRILQILTEKQYIQWIRWKRLVFIYVYLKNPVRTS